MNRCYVSNGSLKETGLLNLSGYCGLTGQLPDQFQYLIINVWVMTALWRVKSNARDFARPFCALGGREKIVDNASRGC